MIVPTNHALTSYALTSIRVKAFGTGDHFLAMCPSKYLLTFFAHCLKIFYILFHNFILRINETKHHSLSKEELSSWLRFK